MLSFCWLWLSVATITHTLKKYRYLRATHRALVVFAKRINYRYTPVKGTGGTHASNGKDFFEIWVGKDQPLEDRVITFSHEIGHALDYVHSPIGLLEKHNRMNNIIDVHSVSREVAAWGYGKQILKDMNCFNYVEDRFIELKERGIGTYVSAIKQK